MYVHKAYGNNTRKKKKILTNCTRLIFCDNQNLPLTRFGTLKALQNVKIDHKFFEIIDFNNDKNDFALVIGCNPSKGSKNCFDSSNLKISKKLNSNYRGYCLLNLYTVLTSSISKLKIYLRNKSNDYSNNFIEIILSLLFTLNGNNIYICWGKKALDSLVLSSFAKNCFKSIDLTKNNFFYSSDKKSEFVHPSDSNFDSFKPLTNWDKVL